jgi:curved DNA-binding protein CbpA
MMKLDPYEELGVDRDATTLEVRKAYRKKVKDTHPDQGGDPEAFNRTKTALAVLTNPAKRKSYDDTGGAPF